MFQSDAQISAVVRVLLHSVRLERLWGDAPSVEAVELLEQGGGPLSSGEFLMLRIAFDLWNNHGRALLGRVVNVLDNERLRLVGSLLVALASGPSKVDWWLEQHQAEDKPHEP